MKRTVLLSILVATVSLVFGGPSAYAQASRTWVSGVGDDANPCSRTAPCKTFAGAISKTAAKGEINALDPGGFGGVTITKAITIDGSGGSIAGILAAGVNGVVINAAAADVIQLRNLEINGAGTGLNGVRFLAGGTLLIENVKIFGFTQKGIDFEPTTTARLVVLNSTITNNIGVNAGGILVKPSAAVAARATLTGVTTSRNQFGLRVEDNGKVEVQDSAMSNNITNGASAVCAAFGACEINIERSLVNDNSIGVATSGAIATIRLSGVGIFNNGTGISAPTGAVVSFGNNQNGGNTTPGVPTSTVPQQ